MAATRVHARDATASRTAPLLALTVALCACSAVLGIESAHVVDGGGVDAAASSSSSGAGSDASRDTSGGPDTSASIDGASADAHPTDGTAGGAVVFNGNTIHGDNFAASGNVLTLPYTVPPGAGRLLVVALGSWSGASPTTFAMTYAGQALTRQIVQARNGMPDTGADQAELWSLVDPPVGTSSIVVTVTTSGAPFFGIVASGWTGVDPTSPIAATGFDAFVGQGPQVISATLACTAGQVVVDALDDDGTPGPPRDPRMGPAPQQLLYSRTTELNGNEIADSSYEACGGSMVTPSWDLTAAGSGPYVAMVLQPMGP